MRNYLEPTCFNFLKEPEIFGVRLLPLLLLIGVVSILQTFRLAPVAFGVGVVGYISLRLQARIAKVGSEEALVFSIEKLLKVKELAAGENQEIEFHSPDTLTEDQKVSFKTALEEEVRPRPGTSKYISVQLSVGGASNRPAAFPSAYVYSLFNLPTSVDPSWLNGQLRGLEEFSIQLRIDAVHRAKAKRMAERSRKRNWSGLNGLTDIASQVAFDESSAVLEGICKGEEEVVRTSLIISSENPLLLDPNYFVLEKKPVLSFNAATGRRKRVHRSHYLRLKTATDLVPSFLDPESSGFLKTRRGLPANFTLVDERFHAHHALVVGSTGAGKSFFTGLALKRLLESGEPASILFVDHRRSFERLSKELGKHIEPTSLVELEAELDTAVLNTPGAVFGIELSELLPSEKEKAADFILGEIDRFLTKRSSTHLVFVVIDECWAFLKNPRLVQQAFREYRKLGAAMIAITHSLGDFLSTENGQVILQSAPIRILLRQEEDAGRYASALNLNSVEVKELRFLQQKKGVYSECLIKSPYHSLIARLYPTAEELALLHTDKRRTS